MNNMAKLNVVIPAVEVTVGDVTYRKVDRKAQAGDIVKVLTDADGDITQGAFYGVFSSPSGKLAFRDDVNDAREYQLRTLAHNYEVFAPISEPATQPPTDTITFEGATWRKVDRDVREGDAIKFTDEDRSSYLTEAELYVVDRVDSFDDPQITDDDGDEYDAGGEDYEVYEKVTDSAAQEYREVIRKAAVGERIKVIAIHPQSRKKGSVSVDEEFTVKTVDSVGDIWSVYEREFNGLISPDFEGVCEYVVLEPVTKSAEPTKPERLAVGDYARVVGPNDNGNDYKIGEIVEIVNEWDAWGRNYVTEAKRADGSTGNYLRDYQVVRATDEEVSAAKRAALTAQFSVGDLVKLVSGGGEYLRSGFTNGDLCTIDENADSDGDFRIRRIKNGQRGYAQPNQLVKLTAAEIAEIERKQAEETKWNAIGRKVNEFKRGDIVLCVGKAKAGLGEVQADSNGSRVSVKYYSSFGTCSETFDIIALVSPVEQRFDTKEVDAA